MSAADLGTAAPAASPRAALLARGDAALAVLALIAASYALDFLALNTAIWVAIYAYFGARIAMGLPHFTAVLGTNTVMLAYPALALISALWSVQPADTLRMAAQLFVTVGIGLFIGTRFSLASLFGLCLAAFALMMVASLVNLTGLFFYPFDHRDNFVGVFLSKSAFGHGAIYFLLTGVFALLRPGTRWPARILVLGLIAPLYFMLSLAGSATATILGVIVPLIALAAYAAMTLRGALGLIAPISLALAAVAVFVSGALGVDIAEALFDLAGRDSTITGRTVLWEFGQDLIRQRPILGYGANAVWTDPALQPQILVLQASYGDGVHSFHNVMIELLVALGPAGLAAHGAMVAVALYRAGRLVSRDRDPDALWALLLVAVTYLLALVSPAFYAEHSLAMLLVPALAAAMARPAGRATR